MTQWGISSSFGCVESAEQAYLNTRQVLINSCNITNGTHLNSEHSNRSPYLNIELFPNSSQESQICIGLIVFTCFELFDNNRKALYFTNDYSQPA